MKKQNIIIIGVMLLAFLSFKSQVVEAASNTGKTETINYQTTYHQKKYQKQATVYLPAKYDASKKHNIVYLMHGSTEGGSDFYQDGNFKQILDKLNRTGKLKNTIAVFPTYYPSRKSVSSDYYSDRPLNKHFAKEELVQDLMPVVEQKYKTYAKTTDDKGFQASRNHRAFGGFSMGAITTWYVFENDLKYFHDFVPMAGDSWTIEPDGGAVASKKTATRLANSVDSKSFKIMAGVGSNDGTSSSMTPQMQAMWQLPEFNHQNLQYYTQKGGSHSLDSVDKQFEHYAGQLFEK
ncbi:alpha/beta hydrolase [Companilactobacillus kimchiensis]|uniref:Glycoside hydrolase n=1 Tax=Companilactobacillus kimchiensis TaxID=993692 RepID=A0A0R2LFS9_9LACO|nr:alpha/beta hydrolase-fold protein [Companilactobacillus kimchiensis]KRN98870.1 glycoside hydrolase [Companilactobacillus kimchiensis]